MLHVKYTYILKKKEKLYVDVECFGTPLNPAPDSASFASP